MSVTAPQLQCDDIPTSRSEARKLGRTVYRGVPCMEEGHDDLRRTNNGACVRCFKAYLKKYKRQRKGLVLVEHPPISEEERLMYEQALK